MVVIPKPIVVQLSSVHPSFDTRIYHKICKSLVKNGYSIDLIIQHQEDEIKDGITIRALPIAQKKSDRFLKIIPKLFKKCIQYPKDTIFHFHDPELIPIGFLLKFFGYKVIYDVHEDVPKDIKSKKWLPFYLRKFLPFIMKWLEKRAINAFSGTIVVTRAIENRLTSENTYLIQNFPIISKPDTSEAEQSKDKFKKSVFYVGDITLIRGLKENIKAVELTNELEDIQFILGGKFTPKELEYELKKEDGWKYVNFVGWIDRQKFNEYTTQSFAGLVTFHPEPNHIDAQPNKLFEYMHAGLPVIAS
ncbi:MAG: glycosyltransferase, partial [Candidatus Paceibacterota bacterium]